MKTLQILPHAPYSDNQRAWLSGFFAGMHSHILHSATDVSSSARVLHILYGTQTGNAESVAHDAATVAKTYGLLPRVQSMSGCRNRCANAVFTYHHQHLW